MFIVIIAITLGILLVSLAFSKRIDYPAVMFSAIWFFIFVLYKLQLFSLTEITTKSEVLLLVMVVSFTVGCFLCTAMYEKRTQKFRMFINKTEKKNEKENEKSEQNFETKLKTYFFWVLCGVTIVILLRDQINLIIKVINGASFFDLMQDAGGKNTVEITGRVNTFLYIFIVHPTAYLISPICATEFFTRSTGKWKYLLVNIIIVALNVMHHGGRNSLILFIITYLLALYILKNKIEIPQKYKNLMVFMVIVIIVLVLGISASRGIDSIWKSFYAYFVCPVPIMQNTLDYSLVKENYTYGMLSFNGLVYPLMTLLSLFGVKAPDVYTITQTIRFYVEDTWIYIGDYSHAMNAFLPPAAYFYIDGGLPAVVIGLFAYGLLCAWAFYRMKERQDNKSVAMHLFLAVGVILSFNRFYFTSYHYFIAFVYMAILYRKKKEDNSLKNRVANNYAQGAEK